MSATMRRITSRADAQQAMLGRLCERQSAALANRRHVPKDSPASGTWCVRLDERSRHVAESVASFSASASPETLSQVETALRRLAAGEHGTCSDCRGRIPTARLRELPFATLCLACQEQLDADRAEPNGRAH